MKKIFILLSVLLIATACTSNEIEPTMTPTPTETPQTTPTIGIYEEESVLYSSYNSTNFENELLKPTRIHVFIGENKDEIGFTYNMGGSPEFTEDDYDWFKGDIKEKYGYSYLYVGNLSKVDENIYSSKGIITPAWEESLDNLKINEEIDFYLVINDDGSYIIFEDLSLDDLRNYENKDTYFNNPCGDACIPKS